MASASLSFLYCTDACRKLRRERYQIARRLGIPSAPKKMAARTGWGLAEIKKGALMISDTTQRERRPTDIQIAAKRILSTARTRTNVATMSKKWITFGAVGPAGSSAR